MPITKQQIIESMKPCFMDDDKVPQCIRDEYKMFIDSIPEEGTSEWDAWFAEMYDINGFPTPPASPQKPAGKKSVRPVRPDTPHPVTSMMEGIDQGNQDGEHAWLKSALAPTSTQSKNSLNSLMTIEESTINTVQKAIELMDAVMEQNRIVKKLT